MKKLDHEDGAPYQLLLAAGIGLVAASTSPPRDSSFKFT
jgi:hypothetical protein